MQLERSPVGPALESDAAVFLRAFAPRRWLLGLGWTTVAVMGASAVGLAATWLHAKL